VLFNLFSLPLGKGLLEGKSQLLATGYGNCDGFIQQLNENKLNCIAGCNAEETLEAKIIKGDLIEFFFVINISQTFIFFTIQNYLIFVILLETFARKSCIQATVR